MLHPVNFCKLSYELTVCLLSRVEGLVTIIKLMNQLASEQSLIQNITIH